MMTEPVFNEPKVSLPDGVQPVGLERDGNSAITINWSDGVETKWTTAQLRKICPCATCREKRKGKQNESVAGTENGIALPVLTAAEAQPLAIVGMKPVWLLCLQYSIQRWSFIRDLPLGIAQGLRFEGLRLRILLFAKPDAADQTPQTRSRFLGCWERESMSGGQQSSADSAFNCFGIFM